MAKHKNGIVSLFPKAAQPLVLSLLYRSFIGGWSPFRLMPSLDAARWPVILWDGSSEKGKHLANRRFTLAGCDISFSRHIGWFSREGSVQWLRTLHSFSWMRDLIAYKPQKMGAKLLRDYVDDWIVAGGQMHSVAAEPEVAGERLVSWVTYAPLMLADAKGAFRKRFLQSLVRQAILLRRYILEDKQDAPLAAIKGLFFVAICIPRCSIFLPVARHALHRKLDMWLEEEGALRAMRNPLVIHDTLRALIEISALLLHVRHKTDESLTRAIGLFAILLENLCHGDGMLAVFNGSIESDAQVIDSTLEHAKNILDAVEDLSLPASETLLQRLGYTRIQAGDTTVVVDTAPPYGDAKEAYCGTLSFEMSHAGERFVVNCGAFIGHDPSWSRVVKTTAAHSTVCVDDRNSCQFYGIPTHISEAKGPQVETRVVTKGEYQFFEATYNGYLPYAGLIHERQLLLNPDGTRFSGADKLSHTQGEGAGRSHDVNLRFHLHPHLQVRRTMNGTVVLQAHDGTEWTFQSSAGQSVELEESIYLGFSGKPLGSTQIVIYMPFVPTSEWVVEWSFIRTT